LRIECQDIARGERLLVREPHRPVTDIARAKKLLGLRRRRGGQILLGNRRAGSAIGVERRG